MNDREAFAPGHAARALARRRTSRLAAAAAAALVSASTAAAQAPPSGGVLRGPALIASGLPIELRGTGFAPATEVVLSLAVEPGRFRMIETRRADAAGRVRFRYRPRRPHSHYVFRFTPAAGGGIVRVRSRTVSLDAVGDINLADGVASVMARLGLRYPWRGVARELRGADVAFGNLECSVSTRGRRIPKEFNFRGNTAALRVARRFAGMDVLNLANNHTGDFGTPALLDTIRSVRRFGMLAVGAGGSLSSAAAPRVIDRLGLRIAFVGFSDIGPASFYAGPRRAGTVPATPAGVARGVRAARRVADVVVATFHWGIERHTTPTGRQRALANVALRAGAAAVIGGHPHVLQPIVRRGRHVVAYSMGNFVWSAGSGPTSRTGILRLALSARGVEHARLLRATIVNTQPRLHR